MLDDSESAQEAGRFFFYIRIHEDIGPVARGERYEDPLADALADAAIGEITGGGSQLGEGNSVEYCGIDVVVDDRGAGLELIRAKMRELRCPQNTVIEEYLPENVEYPVWDEEGNR
jgi:hypothetical protein